MNKSTIIWIVILVTIFLITGGVLIWWKMQNSQNKNDPLALCKQLCKSPWTTYINNMDCVCVPPMLKLDSEINQPTFPVYLINFQFDRQLGTNPWCRSTYYAYRYVSLDNSGRYGPFSEWTQTPVTIQLPPTQLPCPPSGCSMSTTNYCKFNRPSLGTLGSDYSLSDGYVGVLYRKYNLADPDDLAEPVGLLSPDTRFPGPKPSCSIDDLTDTHYQTMESCTCKQP